MAFHRNPLDGELARTFPREERKAAYEKVLREHEADLAKEAAKLDEEYASFLAVYNKAWENPTAAARPAVFAALTHVNLVPENATEEERKDIEARQVRAFQDAMVRVDVHNILAADPKWKRR